MAKLHVLLFLLCSLVIFNPAPPIHAQTLPNCGQGQANGLTDGDIDHYDLVCFTQIPDSFITAAANTDLLWIDRSVGGNIHDGLNCLGSGVSYANAPNSCKSGLDATTFISDTKFNRSRWQFAHYGDGGWSGNVSNFIQNHNLRTPINNVLTPFTPNYDQFDVFNFQFSYLAVAPGSDIVGATGYFVPRPSSTNSLRDVNDMEDFENSRPTQEFVHATTSLARTIGGQTSFDFNNQMRQYAASRGSYVIDFADIGSHTPEGSPCTDSSGYPVLCANYTTEVNGGHLSYGLGKQRVAKAMWLMMTGVAGWQPVTNVTPPPPVTNTPAAPTPTRTPTPTPLPGDFDQDGNLDFADFRLLLNVFNTNNQSYNLVGPSPYLINIFDYNYFLRLW